MSFGARVQAGVNNAAGAVASGVGLAAGMVPGGGIVSAAVSSMTTLTSNGVPGSSTTPYTGTLPSAGGGGGGGAVSTVGVPSVSTTVGGTGGVGIPGTGGGTSGPNFLGGNTGNSGSEFNGELASMFSQQKELIKLQSVMQNESQKYQAVSNVMKVRHETAKNAVGNIR
ncbi:hypothetical protein [Hyalangium gracile]|uniref:hypothetical protein n=1 Tax=Hyalangium gracile TaxID=394092 RepID=UPI001CCF9308|nr:hypothetical protein [Hyalangium gracile]